MNEFPVLPYVCRILMGAFGAVVAVIRPSLPLVLICITLILWDSLSAWQLSRRVKKKYPNQCDGKFRSSRFGKVVATILKTFVAVVLAQFIQEYITGVVFSISLPKVVAGVICGWQAWSILENESSCNKAKWAIVLQKIMVDKTERHLGVDLSCLREDIGDEYADDKMKGDLKHDN